MEGWFVLKLVYFGFTLYPVYCVVSRGNLVLRITFPAQHFEWRNTIPRFILFSGRENELNSLFWF